MSQKHDDVRIDVALSQYQAQDLLRRVAEDDEFRERLQQQPRDALADYGINVSENVLPEVVKLPSKDESERVLDSVRGQDPLFTGRAMFTALSIWFSA